MKIIDAKNTVLGRLASFAAKEALRGEEIAVLNSEKVIITGNMKFIKEDFEAKKTRVGSNQQGPKVSRSPYLIVRRAIRGMLPNHRTGRGRVAMKKIKCYVGIPKEFEGKKTIKIEHDQKNKFVILGEVK